MINVGICDKRASQCEEWASVMAADPDLRCLFTCQTGQEAMKSVAGSPPDVLLLSKDISDVPSMKVLADVLQINPQLRVIIMATTSDEVSVREALKAGAAGYLLKRANIQKIIPAIYESMNGSLPMSTEVAEIIINSYALSHALSSEKLLTPRQREISKRIAAGQRNKAIAAALGLSPETVAVHIKAVYKKLGVHSRKEIMAMLADGLLDGDTFRPRALRAVVRLPFLEGDRTIVDVQDQKRSMSISPVYKQERKYILVLDQSSERSRAVVFDGKGIPIAHAHQAVKCTTPEAGWLECDGRAIWSSMMGVSVEAVESAGISASHIAAIGIANQRETTLIWDRETGIPVYPAITWQDSRTFSDCKWIIDKGHSEWIRAKTGLSPHHYFSAPKIRWILDNVKNCRRLAESGRLLFGTMDSWLLWKCTGGAVHATDITNASRTMLYNIYEKAWDKELLSFFDIPECVLPEVHSSSEVYGVAQSPFIAQGAPVSAMIGGQQAAMFGQCCFVPGKAKCTYGVGSFVIKNTGTKPVFSQNKLLTTIAWRLDEKIVYAVEGGAFSAEGVLNWLSDGLRLVRNVSDLGPLALSVPDNGGLFMVPALEGLGAPYWKPDAQGVLMGLNRKTSAAHIARAGFEGIAFQTRDILKAMEAESGIAVSELSVDGSVSNVDFLMQFLADILRIPVRSHEFLETRTLGTACLAGLAVGMWSDPKRVCRRLEKVRTYEPTMRADDVQSLLDGWDSTIKATLTWAGR